MIVRPHKKKNQPKLVSTELRFLLLFMFLASTFFSGCAVQQRPSEPGTGNYQTLPGKYQKKALEYEGKGMYYEAMQSWWIVQSFYPDNVKIKKRIKTLRKQSRAKTVEHFQKGVSFYQNGQLRAARREFLLTLTFDPDHAKALDYLKNRLQQPVFRSYEVQHGDTLRTVANKTFHDPGKYFLIMAFNDIDSYQQLTPGTTIQIPLLGEDFPGKEKFIQAKSPNNAMLIKPRRQKRKIVATVSPQKLTEEIAQPVDNKKSDVPDDSANYQKAKEFLEQEEYQKSLQMLLTVDINFRDVRQLIASTEVFLQQEADAHYRKGISYFLSEDLDKAIIEWEEVLRLSPNHLKAQKDLQNARRLQQMMKKY